MDLKQYGVKAISCGADPQTKKTRCHHWGILSGRLGKFSASGKGQRVELVEKIEKFEKVERPEKSSRG